MIDESNPIRVLYNFFLKLKTDRFTFIKYSKPDLCYIFYQIDKPPLKSTDLTSMIWYRNCKLGVLSHRSIDVYMEELTKLINEDTGRIPMVSPRKDGVAIHLYNPKFGRPFRLMRVNFIDSSNLIMIWLAKLFNPSLRMDFQQLFRNRKK